MMSVGCFRGAVDVQRHASAGVTAYAVVPSPGSVGSGWAANCSKGASRRVQIGSRGGCALAAPPIEIRVTVTPGAPGPEVNEANVTGGVGGCGEPGEPACPAGFSTTPVAIDAPPLQFGPLGFAQSLLDGLGHPLTQAGAHPSVLTTSYQIPSIDSVDLDQIVTGHAVENVEQAASLNSRRV